MATTEKPRRARERPTLAVVVVLPTPPFPEVMTTTRGVSPDNWGFLLYWRMARTVKVGEGLGFRVLGLKVFGGFAAVREEEGLGLRRAGRSGRESIAAFVALG
ncbi:hypothetical protein ACFX14_042071 [Malus domestica]